MEIRHYDFDFVESKWDIPVPFRSGSHKYNGVVMQFSKKDRWCFDGVAPSIVL